MIGRPVGANDDLFVLPMQGIEGMEEFFLRRFLAGDELDVVDQQHIDAAVAVAKSLGGMRADGIDQVIGEFFRRDVQHLLPLCLRVVADGVQQVSLAQSHPAVQKERIVACAGFSATARQAACASRLEEPTMKLSKV